MGGTERIRCLLVIPRQLPLLACLALLSASLVAVAATATAPTRLAALSDHAPAQSKEDRLCEEFPDQFPTTTTPAAARSASAAGWFTLQSPKNMHHLQQRPKKWYRNKALHSNHSTATSASRRLFQMASGSGSSASVDLLRTSVVDEGGGTPDAVQDYVYPLDADVLKGAIPKGHLWFPLNLSKDLSGVLDRSTERKENALTFCADYSLADYNGACCTIRSYVASVDGCMVVVVFQGVGSSARGLQEWTKRLPAGVKVLDASGLEMIGGLPVLFGNATTSLEELFFSSSNFTGTLPEEWAALSSIRSIDVSLNPSLVLVSRTSPAWVMPAWGELPGAGSTVCRARC